MHEIFDTNPIHDPNINEISFSDKDGKFIMEIVAKNKDEAIALKGRIFGLRGIYEMDSPTYQNFNIECNESTGTVILTGNISNAFNILKEKKLISANIASEILRNTNVTNFLRQTSAFVLPEHRENPHEITKPNAIENLTVLQKNYVDALAKLEPAQLEMALNSLASSLAEKGSTIEIKVHKSESGNKLQIVH